MWLRLEPTRGEDSNGRPLRLHSLLLGNLGWPMGIEPILSASQAGTLTIYAYDHN